MKEDLRKVLVVGTGKSGIAAAGLILAGGGSVVLFDENTKIDEEDCIRKAREKAEAIEKQPGAGKRIVCEGEGTCKVLKGLAALTPEALYDVTLSIFSPGVPLDTEVAERIREQEIPIRGEIELAWYFEKGTVLAITGTNGKTTTTSLLGQIMKRHADKVLVVGNIGTPYTEEVLCSSEDSYTVAEISSFQLETTRSFHPHVSAILNLTPDHLNRHHTMENYVLAKQHIAEAQTKEDVCVLNAADPYTDDFLESCPARTVLFSSVSRPESGFFYKAPMIYKVGAEEEEALLSMDETHLLGTHNAENIMAAIAMAEAAGVPMDTILEAVRDFHAVEHRIEYVRTADGVDYYNDSKGTNPDAAIKAICAMVKPTWLIGGGYDKDSTYDEWIESFQGKVRGLVLVGQTKEKIAACARAHGFTDIYIAETFEEAVQICHDHAKSGEAVLLSPACASWGMFTDYEERGRIFKDLVKAF